MRTCKARLFVNIAGLGIGAADDGVHVQANSVPLDRVKLTPWGTAGVYVYGKWMPASQIDCD